jgi:hypothetical protein
VASANMSLRPCRTALRSPIQSWPFSLDGAARIVIAAPRPHPASNPRRSFAWARRVAVARLAGIKPAAGSTAARNT